MRHARAIAVIGGPAFAAVVCTALVGYANYSQRPTSRVMGRAVAQETGVPVPEVDILLIPEFRDEGSRVPTRQARTDQAGSFVVPNLPIGVYTIRAHSKSRSCEARGVRIAEGQIRHIALEMAPNPERIEVDVHQHVFTPDEPTQALCRGFVDGDELRVACYKVDYEALVADPGLALEDYLQGRGERAPLAPGPPYMRQVGARDVTIEGRDIEGAFSQYVEVPSDGPGFYLFTVAGGSVNRPGYFTVSDLGLVTKRQGGRLFAYVAALASGEPRAGVRVDVYAGKQHVEAAATGPDGLCEMTLPKKETGLIVMARRGPSLAVVDDYLYPPAESTGPYRLYAYTDRPVYRPGQEVHFKGVLRERTDKGYSVPGARHVKVAIADWRETMVYEKELTTTRLGSFFDTVRLSESALTGQYLMRVTVGEQELTSSFDVATYRKPDFEVEVTPVRERYTRGETAQVEVRAQYYFGAPVAGARVSSSAYRAPYWIPSGDEREWERTYRGMMVGAEAMRSEQEAPEDYRVAGVDDYRVAGVDEWDLLYDSERSDRPARTSFEEAYGEAGGARADYGELVTGGRTALNQDGVARIRIPTRPRSGEKDEEVENDHMYRVSVSVEDAGYFSVTAAGEFVVARGRYYIKVVPTPRVAEPGEPVNVAVTACGYDGVPVANTEVAVRISRSVTRNGQTEYIEESSESPTLGSDGKLTRTYLLSGQGAYLIEVTGRDGWRNRIVGTASVWVTSKEGGDLDYTYPELEIVPDRSLYSPGDTARLLLNGGELGRSALLSFESDDRLVCRRIELPTKSTMIEVPITDDMAPNIYVGITVVAGKRFLTGRQMLRVTPVHKELNIAVSADKDVYTPGETATFTVTTKDADGEPIPAEASLGLVDESVYAVKPDNTPNILAFFYQPRCDNVVTRCSFPVVYLNPGDKGGTLVTLRRRFLDTAFWTPDVVTDSQGQAIVKVALPDNLTTWRATVRAHTADTEVGTGTLSVVSRKPLMAKLEAPRFLCQGDRARVGGLVYNATGVTQDVSVTLGTEGLDGPRRPSAHKGVKPDQSGRFLWDIAAPLLGESMLRLTASAGSETDGLELAVPVVPFGRERVLSRSVVVREGTQIRFDSAPDRVPGTSRIRVSLAPSISATVFGSLDYLADYPWGCTEQTMSAFMPDVVLSRCMHDLGVDDPRLEHKLDQMVPAGLARLYGFQNDEGGWGWARYGDGDSWMTTYVLHGLLMAREAGYQVNQLVLESGLSALRRQRSSNDKVDPLRDLRSGTGETDPYELYVLALGKGLDKPALETLHEYAAELQRRIPDRAHAALALLAAGNRQGARAQVEQLWAECKRTPGVRFWTDSGYGAHGRSEIEATAAALMAICRVTPEDPRAAEVVEWLLRARDGTHWRSTRDTAQVLYALAEYLRATHELQPDCGYTVLLNGSEVASGRFSAEDVWRPQRDVEIDPTQVAEGANVIEIQQEGPGRIYCGAELDEHIALQEGEQPVTNAGMTVERAYYRLRPMYDEGLDRIRLQSEGDPSARFRSGDAILVCVDVHSEADRGYVLIEDPIPAGCEIAERPETLPEGWSKAGCTGVDVRDDLVAAYVSRLRSGTTHIEYKMRASIPGEFHALPTHVWEMYRPDQHAYSNTVTVRIRG